MEGGGEVLLNSPFGGLSLIGRGLIYVNGLFGAEDEGDMDAVLLLKVL